jgi:hypothetical protein
MRSYKKSDKISNYQNKQLEFLEKLQAKGFKNAKILNETSKQYMSQKEDKKLIIIK